MKFAYSGFDKAGQPVSGSIDGATREDAADALLKRGVYVNAMSPARASGGHGSRRVPFLGGGKRLEQAAVFLRQLAVLVSTGTTLVDAIGSIERQQPAGAWQRCLADLRERVEEGTQLSDAMASHPAYFDGVCRSLIAAGESGGKLDDMLTRLAALMRQQVRIRKTLSGAMIYPVLLIFVAIGVVITMIGFVLPRFEGLFQSIDAPLPPTTKYLMEASEFLRAYWYVFAGVVAAGVVTTVVVLRHEAGRAAWETLLMRLPALGRLARSFAAARVARVLGVLLESRVPMMDALKLTKAAAGRKAYADLIQRAEDAVTRGDNISLAFADPSLINPSVCEAVRSGERTGQVGPVLVQVAQHMDEDNEVLLKTVTGLIEPAILLVLGLIVGAMAISMFMPLFDLAAAGGRQ